MSSASFAIVEALATALGVISVTNGYNTDIGTKIVLYDQQRPDTDRPSIAIGARAGKIDRRDQNEPVTGHAYDRRARQLDLSIEVGLNAAPEDAERIAHDALEDIERVFLPMLSNNSAMPAGVARISFTDWSILDRPDGIDACVLRIVGTVDYSRKPN